MNFQFYSIDLYDFYASTVPHYFDCFVVSFQMGEYKFNFVLLKIILPTTEVLYFYTNFRMRVSVSIRSAEILMAIML